MPEPTSDPHSIAYDKGLKQWDKGQTEINMKFLIQSAAFACGLVSTEPERYIAAVRHLEANVMGTLSEKEVSEYKNDCKLQRPKIESEVKDEGQEIESAKGMETLYWYISLWKYAKLVTISNRNRAHDDDVEV